MIIFMNVGRRRFHEVSSTYPVAVPNTTSYVNGESNSRVVSRLWASMTTLMDSTFTSAQWRFCLAQSRDFIYTAKYNLKSFIPVNVEIRDNDDSKVVINAAQPPRVAECDFDELVVGSKLYSKGGIPQCDAQYLVSLATEPYGEVKVVVGPDNAQYGLSVLGKRKLSGSNA